MIIILILAAVILVLYLLWEVAHIMTYGWFVSPRLLNSLLTDNLKDYYLNPYKATILMHPHRKPPIWIASTTYSKWYIQDIGTIPRWSKWSRALDEQHNQLIAKS